MTSPPSTNQANANQQNSNQSGATNELKADAQQLGKSAKDKIHSELDARKGSAANQVKSVSTAMERTAGGLDDNAPEWLRSAIQQGAQQVQRFADTLEQKDSRAIVNEVRTFARDNPTTFLAACAAAGFAAARIFKAGGSSEYSQGFRSQNQGPPPRVDEPTFRSPTGVASPTRGEFV